MAQENDIVLVYFEDSPLTFARIESISSDMKRDWYHVKLLILQVPIHAVTWILKDIYIDGEEFTMNGKRMRMELVVCPEDTEISDDQEEQAVEQPVEQPKEFEGTNVISFASHKKKKVARKK